MVRFLLFRGPGMSSPVRDRRSHVDAAWENPSRDTSRTPKGDTPWDSVHPTIRFRSFSSMSFSLSERRPWLSGSGHKITTPHEEATRRPLCQGGGVFSSPFLFFPFPIFSFSANPNGLMSPHPCLRERRSPRFSRREPTLVEASVPYREISGTSGSSLPRPHHTSFHAKDRSNLLRNVTRSPSPESYLLGLTGE